jgi:hypothetical protein
MPTLSGEIEHTISMRGKISLLRERGIEYSVSGSQKGQVTQSAMWEELFFELTGIDPRICPRCEKGRMIRKEVLQPVSHPSP